MNYPIYDIHDLYMVPKEGTYEYSDFHDLISDLLKKDLLESSTEIGIAKYILANGTKSLSGKQSYIIQKVTNRYNSLTCNRCALAIPFSEVIFSMDNGGLCDYCNHQVQKEHFS